MVLHRFTDGVGVGDVENDLVGVYKQGPLEFEGQDARIEISVYGSVDSYRRFSYRDPHNWGHHPAVFSNTEVTLFFVFLARRLNGLLLFFFTLFTLQVSRIEELGGVQHLL